jgi:hypothetical protein
MSTFELSRLSTWKVRNTAEQTVQALLLDQQTEGQKDHQRFFRSHVNSCFVVHASSQTRGEL